MTQKKKKVLVSIDNKLYDEAREYGVKISTVCNNAIEEYLEILKRELKK